MSDDARKKSHVDLVEVQADTPIFAAVQKLWRPQSSTLGFMPEGGFRDAARLLGLVAAVTADGAVLGYVMFRRTAQRITSIVHLCIDPQHRGAGIARRLIDEVKSRCRDCYEIRLQCRRDFAAHSLWPTLGFVAVAEERGRSGGGILTVWRYELEALPLLRVLAERPVGIGRVRAVVDANVFFDLDDAASDRHDSEGLLADWLNESVEFCVTEELFNEINRGPNEADRNRHRGRAQRFVVAPRDVARQETVEPGVRKVLGQPDTQSARSDTRQVAMTVAAGITFFITRDAGILAAAEELDEQFGVVVLAPYEVVRRFDELRREEEYQPRRLFYGAGVRARIPRADDLERLADLMHHGQTAPEPRRQSIARLRQLLASPERFEGCCVDQDGDLLAAYFLDRCAPQTLAVPFFAVAASSLGSTAARHYGEALVETAVREGRTVVHIREAGLRIGDALGELGFSEEPVGWVKICLRGTRTLDAAAGEVARIARVEPTAEALATRVGEELRELMTSVRADAIRVAQVERALWPAKLTGAGFVNFIVPIQARWARDLFDHELAATTLFGADPTLALNCENVYYRAARPAVVKAPARVLWYVSDDDHHPESKAMRACSFVDEVVVGPPKELYRRFRRLGVYSWKDVSALAGHDTSKNLMAFRFSKTELLQRPVDFAGAQRILKQHTGRGSYFQSPLAVSEECFTAFYNGAVEGDGA